MSQDKGMLGNVAEIFKESAKGIVEYSRTRENELERWSDQKPISNGRRDSQCVGFISKQEFSNDVNFVMDIVSIPEDSVCDMRIWIIRTEVGDNEDEVFNQISITFNISEEIAQREIQKGKKFATDDLMNILDKDIMSISRVVLSNNTGQNSTTEKRYGLRQDYDFISKTLFTSSEKEPKESKVTYKLDEAELKMTLKTIMRQIKKPKAIK